MTDLHKIFSVDDEETIREGLEMLLAQTYIIHTYAAD